MPTLSYTESNTLHAGVLNSRVLIGRRLSHGVVLEDASVSRLHAWIDPVADENAEWVVTDAGSKKGTFVNGLRITRSPLHDGDIIRVGDVALTYHDQDMLPTGAAPVEFSAPAGVVRASGILFECACGAPIWVGSDLAGKRGRCRHCKQPITVPGIAPEPEPKQEPEPEPKPKPTLSPAPAPPVPAVSLVSVAASADSKRSAKCAICHADILEGEEKIQCPDCAMNFHSECWQENLGCSSYGCPQVNSLAPATSQSEQKIAEPDATSNEGEPHSFPWDTILLAAAVVGSLLGALLFGSIAAIVAIFSLIILIQGKGKRPAFLFIAIIICLIGIAAGLGVSDFWYFGGRHLPVVIRQYAKYLH